MIKERIKALLEETAEEIRTNYPEAVEGFSEELLYELSRMTVLYELNVEHNFSEHDLVYDNAEAIRASAAMMRVRLEDNDTYRIAEVPMTMEVYSFAMLVLCALERNEEPDTLISAGGIAFSDLDGDLPMSDAYLPMFEGKAGDILYLEQRDRIRIQIEDIQPLDRMPSPLSFAILDGNGAGFDPQQCRKEILTAFGIPDEKEMS